MITRLSYVLPVMASLGVAVALETAESQIAMSARMATTLVAAIVLFAGIFENRPRRSLASHWTHPDPWSLIGLALLVSAWGDAMRLVPVLSAYFPGSPSFERSLCGLTITVAMAMALAEMARQRFGEPYRDHILEATILGGSITMVAWVAALEPYLKGAGISISTGAPYGVALCISLIFAIWACSLLASFDKPQPALSALAISQCLPVLVVVMRFFGDFEGHELLTSLSTAVSGIGIAFAGWAAGHPSMNLYEEPATPVGARLGELRLANLLFPVTFGPAVLVMVLTEAVDLSPMPIAGFAVVLSSLVIFHLIGMVQARASSTHWASHDKLTGLPNRAMFRERCSQALDRGRKLGQPAAVLYLDLDRFKHINDSMGHEAGDQLLALVAKRILSCVDEGDTVARLGGDEFAILLPHVDNADTAGDLARRLLSSFAAPFNLKPRPVLMSPSVGISVSDDTIGLEAFLTQADTAMYRAKESGRNRFAVWSIEMNQAANERVTLEMHLHSALARDELRLVYQPKVDLSTGRVMGVEALLRWHHPILGIVPPNTFIHLAEESGLITQIGEWVLETACYQAKAWMDAGFNDVTMAVNMSSRQFQHQRVANVVSRTLRRTGLPPRLLELELTESMAMSGEDSTVNQLNELRELGVTCAIDDFGTGYSNLSYLSRFPVDTLKIDKAFVQQIDKSGGDAAIVVAIIAMAHRLGLNVVAEGVETPQQAMFLRENECDIMQGYLFSRPVPPDDLVNLFSADHRPPLGSAVPRSDPRRRFERSGDQSGNFYLPRSPQSST